MFHLGFVGQSIVIEIFYYFIAYRIFRVCAGSSCFYLPENI